MTIFLDRWVGVSTYGMPSNGENIFEGLEKAHSAGMGAIEIVPSDHEGSSGFPVTRPAVGFNLDTFTASFADKLAKACSCFETVTVHSPAQDLNLAAYNAGIRRESVRQYLKCIEIANTIGAGWVTFHPGNYVDLLCDDRVIQEHNVEFGKQAAELAEKYDLVMGYEDMGSSSGNHFEHLIEVIDRIGSRRFGLNFDIGHACMLDSPDPYEWLTAFEGRIVEVHLHAAFHRPDRGVETHMPLDFEDYYPTFPISTSDPCSSDLPVTNNQNLSALQPRNKCCSSYFG